MSQPFTTRIEESTLTLFRRAAEKWAERQKPGVLSRPSSPLTRWMISILIPAAKEELNRKGDRR